jgi:hypothetical protein
MSSLAAVADAKQRNLMAAEFYGKEYVLFENGTLNNTQGAHMPGCWWRRAAPCFPESCSSYGRPTRQLASTGGRSQLHSPRGVAVLAGVPAHLGDLMPHVDGGKQRSIIQHMSKDLIPIMEKGLVDCPLVHRCERAV